MRRRRIWVGWLSLAAGVLCVNQGPGVRGQGPASNLQGQLAAGVPVAQIASGLRESVNQVIHHPTLFSCAPAEAFGGDPALYVWLLDHPERGVLAWQRLGAPCT